jgi:tetratricopeptide (TPR) repeat protein
MGNLKKTISDWDQKIRAGRSDDVRAAVSKLQFKKLQRQERLQIAKVCRRVQLYSLGTKALFSVVRGDGVERVSPSAAETSEYAASLLRIGSIKEVRTLLSKVDGRESPEAFLYLAFAEIIEWNFSPAVDLLTTYLGSPDLSDYQRRVAQVNLAAALLGCQRHYEALPLLESLIEEASRLNESLVLAMALFYLGDLYFQTNDYKSARSTLELARKALPPSNLEHHLLIDKLTAMIDAQIGSPGGTIEVFDQIKIRAREIGAPETSRDCDFAKAKWHGDRNAFLSAFVGTIFPSFRSKCLGLPYERPQEVSVRKVDLGEVLCSTELDASVVDIQDPPGLRIGQSVHRALVTLLQDFYRPVSMGELYEALFPQTYFDPFTAQNRIHQTLLRLRSWVEEQELGWTVRVDPRGLVLINGHGPAIRMQTERPRTPLAALELLVIEIYKKFGARPFDILDLFEHKLCTRSQAHRCLAQAVENEYLQRFGKGRSTKYRFIRNPSPVLPGKY